MDEETNKIKQHIDTEREQLGANLDELEGRVKNATDPKAYFNKNTGWILGAAVAGGFLLSLAMRRSSPSDNVPKLQSERSRDRIVDVAAPSRFPVSTHLHRVSETLDDIFEGLVGVVSDKLQSFVGEAVPGFRQQYDDIERQRGRSSVT